MTSIGFNLNIIDQFRKIEKIFNKKKSRKLLQEKMISNIALSVNIKSNEWKESGKTAKINQF